MEVFSVSHIDLCVHYYNGLSYKDPIRMFRMRQEFAKKYSKVLLGKDFSELDLDEKFNVTYMVTNACASTSIKDFILESGFRNLHKNQREFMLYYYKMEFLDGRFKVDDREPEYMQYGRFGVVKNVMESKLNINFLYRIYNQSIKKPKQEVCVNDLRNFESLVKNGKNIETISKLRNKLFLQRESVSACIIMNAQRYCYCDLDDYWNTLKKEIRELKKVCIKLPLPELECKIRDTFKNYFAITPYYKTRPLDGRVNRKFINKDVYNRIRPLNATVEELNKFGKKLYDKI